MDNLSLREILRYGYTGILYTLVVAVVDPNWVSRVLAMLGDVLSPLAVLGVGASAYLLYKNLIGDLFLRRLLDRLHAKSRRCAIGYLREAYGVPINDGPAAYGVIRDRLLRSSTRERVHLLHSESYPLFVTFVITGVASILAFVHLFPTPVSPGTATTLGAVSALSLAAGIRNDVVACGIERGTLSELSEAEIVRVLQDAGFKTN